MYADPTHIHTYIYAHTYTYIRNNKNNNNSHLDGPRDLLAGMLSGFVCKVFEFPFDTIKVLQQTQGDKYKGAIDCTMQTIRAKGYLSLYQRLASPLIRYIHIYACVYFKNNLITYMQI